MPNTLDIVRREIDDETNGGRKVEIVPSLKFYLDQEEDKFKIFVKSPIFESWAKRKATAEGQLTMNFMGANLKVYSIEESPPVGTTFYSSRLLDEGVCLAPFLAVGIKDGLTITLGERFINPVTIEAWLEALTRVIPDFYAANMKPLNTELNFTVTYKS